MNAAATGAGDVAAEAVRIAIPLQVDGAVRLLVDELKAGACAAELARHAAGVAAAMAAAADAPVQKIDVPALQGKLRAQDQVIDFIPGEPESWSDIHKGTNGPAEF